MTHSFLLQTLEMKNNLNEKSEDQSVKNVKYSGGCSIGSGLKAKKNRYMMKHSCKVWPN